MTVRSGELPPNSTAGVCFRHDCSANDLLAVLPSADFALPRRTVCCSVLSESPPGKREIGGHWTEILNLFQGSVDRRQLSIYSRFYPGDSDKNAKSDPCGNQAVLNSCCCILIRKEAANRSKGGPNN
jgi:hypothetical protein